MNTAKHIRRREIARAGIFGTPEDPVIVTEKDLLEIAETFSDIKTAPVQFGHESNAFRPRLGNVTAVRYSPLTQALEADIEENDVLKQAVDQGYYPDVSIGAKTRASDGKLYLHHLAYLGEQPPAVKALQAQIQKDITASEQDDTPLRTFPPAHLNLADSSRKENKPQKEILMTEEEIKAMQEENARLKTEAEAKEKLLADAFLTKRRAEIETLNKAVEGKLTAPQKEKLIALCDSFGTDAGSQRTVELADGTNKRSASQIEVLAEIFSAMPLPVAPGEISLSDPAPARQDKTRNLSAEMLKAM